MYCPNFTSQCAQDWGGGKFAKRPVTTHPFPASLIRTNSQATGKNDDSRFLSYEEKSIIVRTVK